MLTTAVFELVQQFYHVRAGVPNLFLTMYPFSIPTNEHVPLQHFNR